MLVDGLIQVPDREKRLGFAVPQMTGDAGLKTRRTMIRSMVGPSASPEIEQRILKMMLGASEMTAAGAMVATWDPSQWKSDVIAVPVLAIYAERSSLANRVGMKSIFPTAEYHEIAGTGHFLMMERPNEFNSLLRTFLTSIQ